MNPYWEGKLVRLRALEPDDAEHFYRINMEAGVDRNQDMVYPPSSRTRTQSWVEEGAKKTFGESHEFLFIIEERSSGQTAGAIDTHHVNPRQGTFEYGLSVREQFRNKGYASEAVLLVLRYYFFELRYRKAEPSVFAFNDASAALHEKLGFVLEGRKRHHGYSHGQVHDLLLFGMTADEFRELHPMFLVFPD